MIILDNKNEVLWFKIIGFAKLTRIPRLGDIITRMNWKNDIKTMVRLIRLVFFILLFIHCLACVWYKIVDETKIWVPPLDYMYLTTNLYTRSPFFKYMSSIYHAFLIVGGNDIGARNQSQMSFISLMLFVGAIINAIIFGNMAVMVQSLNRKHAMFQEKIETANDAMENLNLTLDIRDDVKYYLSYTHSALNHQKELDSFLVMLSPSLKQKVISCIFTETIMSNSVFENHQNIMDTFLMNLEVKLFLPEDKIIAQDDQNI